MPVVVYPVAAFLVSFLLLLWSVFGAFPMSAVWGLLFATAVCGALMAVTLNFFRDPERTIGKGVVSPADGLLVRAEATDSGAYFSIFMNVHDVHVNRAPWPGRVTDLTRVSGGHRPAYEKGAAKNERLRVTIDGSLGPIVVTQMVGMVARRILPYVNAGRMLKKGERIGIIRLGSRVDLFVPSTQLELAARKGDRVLAGATTLALVKGGRAADGDRRAGQRDGGSEGRGRDEGDGEGGSADR